MGLIFSATGREHLFLLDASQSGGQAFRASGREVAAGKSHCLPYLTDMQHQATPCPARNLRLPEWLGSLSLPYKMDYGTHRTTPSSTFAAAITICDLRP